MECNPLTKGYRLGSQCKGTSGITAVWIGTYLSDLVIARDVTTKEITSITATSPAVLPTFYKFEMKQETGQMSDTSESANGNVKYNTTLTLSIQDMSPDIANTVKTLVRGYYTVIVLDNDGRYRVFGHQSPADVTSAPITTGTVYTDVKGATLEFGCVSINGAEYLEADAFALLDTE